MNLLGAIVLDCDVFFSESCVRTLVLQLIALFEDVVEPLGDGASLEELGHWEQTWGLDSSASFPVHSLNADTVWPASFLFLPNAFPLMLYCCPLYTKINSFYLLLTEYFITSVEKIIKRVPHSKFTYTAQLAKLYFEAQASGFLELCYFSWTKNQQPNQFSKLATFINGH